MNKKYFIVLLLFLILIFNLKNILKFFYPVKYDTYVIKYSIQNNMDPYLIFALIKAESNFREDVVSHKGAIGLMQITPQTGKYIAKLLKDDDFNTKNLFDPEVNIKYGVFYFAKLYRDFDGNIEYVLAAYNAGEGNVRKWLRKNNNLIIDDFPFLETRIYVKKVKLYYIKYKWIYESKI